LPDPQRHSAAANGAHGFLFFFIYLLLGRIMD
jgi:hypothetical protein